MTRAYRNPTGVISQIRSFHTLSSSLLALVSVDLPAQVRRAPQVAAKSYLLYDFQPRQTLAADNADERVEPASLTKLMTAYLVFSALKQKTLHARPSRAGVARAWNAEGSRMFIEPAKPVTVDELLRGMIVQSGNDACIALAEAVAGSEESVRGADEPRGAAPGHEEHPFRQLDRAAASAALLDRARSGAARRGGHPRFSRALSAVLAKEYRYNNITQPNRNRLLWSDPTVDGMKTGYTENAGYCLVSSAKRGERRLISVVLGAAFGVGARGREPEAAQLRLPVLRTVRLYEKGATGRDPAVWKGTTNKLKAGFDRDLFFSPAQGRRRTS